MLKFTLKNKKYSEFNLLMSTKLSQVYFIHYFFYYYLNFIYNQHGYEYVQILKTIYQVQTFLQTVKTEHGYEFTCQHGPIECEANIIHACSIDIIQNSSIQLEYLSCMIKNKLKPVNIMKTCAKKMNIDYNKIFKCSTGVKGKNLLAKYGELTKSLTPEVFFIPTVVLDGVSFQLFVKTLKLFKKYH